MLIIPFLAFNACSKAKDERQVSKAGSPEREFVELIRKGTLTEFPSSTIGEAFDSYKYLTGKDWKAHTLKSGHVTVDFSGWFKGDLTDDEHNRGVEKKGLEVKFVIDPNGVYYAFMVTKIEELTDGTVVRTPYNDIKGVLTAIYSNHKINI